MKENIDFILAKIQKISNLLYQQKRSESFVEFTELLNELSMVSEQLFILKRQGEITFNELDYVNTLTEAMNALESKDDVLVADILNYELTNQLEEINLQL